MPAESARDRMAYIIWCVRHQSRGFDLRGDNVLLFGDDHPSEHTSSIEECPKCLEIKTMYEAADLILEMLRHDVLKLVHGGEAGLDVWYDDWSEGIKDALGVLGWEDPHPLEF